MPAACLAATGQEQWPLAIVAIVAVVLLVVGTVLIARKRSRAALLIAPLAVLALVLGGTVAQPAPAQAVTVKIADTVMSTEWNFDWPDISSDVPSAGNFALFQQAAALQQAAGTIPIYQTFITWPGDDEFPAETFEAVPNIAGLDASNAVVELDGNDVEDAIADWWAPLPMERDIYTLTVTITFNYVDDCGKPLQTVFTYTGEFDNRVA